MTVSAPNSAWGPYTGNGVTTVFDYSGVIDDDDELVLTKLESATGTETTLVKTTDYTVQGVGGQSGGTVTLLVALPIGFTLTIRREVSIVQETDLRNQGSYFAENHERVFDRLTKICQQLAEKFNRTLKISKAEVGSETAFTIPAAATRASKFLGFDASGNPIAAAGTSANLGPVSNFIDTLLDDADAATARSTLGVPSSAQAINPTIVTAKGDLIAATASGAVARRGVGSDGDLLIPNSGQTTGLQYLQLPMAASLLNGKFAFSVAGNALTVAVKGLDGADPSATNPVFVVFRDSDPLTSSYFVRKITAALSVTVSAGSTLGTVSNQPFKVWIAAIDNAGTVELAVYQSLDSTLNIKALRDNAIISTTAEGGAGAADSAGVLYSASARTSVAMRVLGYGEWNVGLGTAGNWASVPTGQQLYAPGVPLPGDRIAHSNIFDGAVATTTTLTPNDDTIPQNTEGGQFQSLTHTRQQASAVLNILSNQTLSCSGSNYITAALFQDSTADALAAVMCFIPAAQPKVVPLHHRMRAGATGNTTLKTRAGPDSASTVTFNGFTGARKLGGSMASVLQIEEVAT
jgi:hypothetical protein